MSVQPALERADVLQMLQSLNERATDPARERLSSMEVAWIVHQVEQRYSVELDLDDDQLAKLRTIDDAVRLLGESLQTGGG
jgi:acyl carrier protein